MTRAAIDLHMHSVLSPCGDEGMTPNNIVGMAQLKELDVIALTDHNSAANLPALMAVAKGSGVTVLPGIEVTTKEEAHILTYFENMEAALDFGEIVYGHLPAIPNRPDFFGHQYILDEEDEIVGELDKLLISATDLSIDRLETMVMDRGGILVPAHIDRKSYSIMVSLGFVPTELKVDTLEVSRATTIEAVKEKYRFFKEYAFIQGSDAHCLEDMAERTYFLELLDLRKKTILKALCPSFYIEEDGIIH